ncbi:ABC transporter ATP-binding protein [Bifidobacterium mongoliense]|uniref:ABC transporter ATP-binding protein n=1 Tax=Bifidobacterium mongoliense TaxID=518643 RepID=UPI002A755461|nr:ABC transporter ATP-binding protein [Bifidobacterium mongoliense]MDY3126499.1 ABC transporter ATP-binding protein [Bifidobacterium mongoliense]
MQFFIDHLSKSYDGKPVLKDIDFTFDDSKIYGLLGRNGAGKTTLFNALNRDITVDGGDFGLIRPDGSRGPILPEDLGYVLSTPQVPEFLTAREFLKFFLEINAKRVPVHREVDEYFDDLRIEPADRDRLLKDYSQGMKNKMQMIVNIIANPAVLLLDEPLTSLDVVVAEEMKQLLRSMKSGRVTILSTHLLDLAVGLCDEIVLLHDGRLQEVPKSNLDDEDFKNRIIAALSHGASLDSDEDAGPAADAAIEAEVAADAVAVAEAPVSDENPHPAPTLDRGGEHA